MVKLGWKGCGMLGLLFLAGLALWLWPRDGAVVGPVAEEPQAAVAVYSAPLALGEGAEPASKGSVSLGFLGDDLELLDERLSQGATKGTALREQVFAVPGLGYPVRVEQELLKDPVSGEEQVLKSVEMAADRLIGRFEAGVELEELRTELAGLGMRLGRRLMGESVFEVLLPSGELDAVPQGLAAARSSAMAANLVYLEPDYIVRTMVDPSDPNFLDGSQWALDNSGQEGGLANVDIDGPEGWALRSEAGQVVVAVIDTGINYLHPDLVPNVWVNSLEIAGNGIDDDGNGWIDDAHGINVVVGSGDPFDDNGHGTHCTGTIGAEGNNGKGVAGVAWGVQLMGLKFLSADGGGKTSDAIVCIEYALEMGADLLSNSWGGGGYSQALYDAIAVAEESGVAFVAAAGNAASDNDEQPSYPASYDLDNVVAVASVDRFGELSVFSNYGLNSVDLAAPGTDILSTWIGEEEYRVISGTSMATPHVSGVLALLLAQYPESGLEEQLRRLYYGGKRLSALEDEVAYGVIPSLEGSLLLAEAPSLPVFSQRPPRVSYQSEGSDWEVSVSVLSEYPVSYEWFLDGVKLEGEEEPSLSIANLGAEDAGVYRVVASNQDGEIRARVSLQVLAADRGLADAVDASFLDVFSFGDAEWQRYGFDSVLGSDCIRSGEIGDDEKTTVYTEVMGPGQVSFSWRLSSERYWDYGAFLLDGEAKALLREPGDWSQQSVALPEARTYRLEWEYRKDGSGTGGQDALFVDGVSFGSAEESPPVILRGPVGGLVGSNASYELSVEAVGAGLGYQWFKDGEALAGEVAERLAIVASSSEVAGAYSVVVSNGFGEAASTVARIEVGDVPARIVSHPESVTVLAGASVTFEVELEGSLPYLISWYKDGELIVGADASRFTISAASVSDAGEYVARVSNAAMEEAVQSSVARLEVRELSLAPRFVKQPQSGYWQNGDTLRLSAAVEGSFPFTYQWFKDGVAIPGENGRALVREAAVDADAGSYYLEARNAFGVASSASARVRVLGDIGEAIDLPELDWRVEGTGYFFAQNEFSLDGVDALESGPGGSFFGTPTSVFAEVEGPTNFSVFWREESSWIPSTVLLYVDGEAAAILSAGKDWSEARAWVPEGRHRLSFEASLEIDSRVWIDQGRLSPAPAIYAESGSLALQRGEDASLWVEAKGAGTLAYQWYRDGVPIQGAVSSVYAVSSASELAEGDYYVDTTSEHGAARSSTMQVRVFDSLAAEVGDGTVALELGDGQSWFGTVLAGGDVALRSGEVVDGEEKVLSAVVSGPGALVFDLGMRAAGCCASLRLFVDGQLLGYYSDSVEAFDEVELEQRAVYLGDGEHRVEWRFNQGSTGAGVLREAYLDNIRLLQEPVFARHPQDTRVVERSSATLSVSMVGPGPFLYQWFKDEVALAGERSAQLTLSEASEEIAGSYYCVAENAAGLATRSKAAEVSVTTGFYEALGLDFGSMVSGGTNWRPVQVETPVGLGALRFEAGDGISLSSLVFDIEVPLGELRALEFWIRADGMGPSSLVQIFENSDRYVDILESESWQRVTLPLGKSGVNRLSLTLRRGGDWVRYDPDIMLAGFRLLEAPVVSQSGRSGGLYWGDTHLFAAQVVGRPPFSYQWSRAGQALGGSAATTGNLLRQVVPRLNDDGEGVYELAVDNGWGPADSSESELRLLDSGFGMAAGLPGTRIRTFGDGLWEVDTEEALSGDRSLAVDGLGALESSDLVFDLTGPGVFSMNWKMDSPSGKDELSITGSGKLLRGGYSTSDWVPYELEVPSGTFQFRIRMLNRMGSGVEGGRAWVDGLRFRRAAGESFGEWAERAFQGSALGEADRGPSGDPEGDGLPNLAEYAFGFDPLGPELFPVPSLEGGLLLADFPLAAGAVDVEMGLEVSRDLATWYPLRSQYETREEEGQLWGRLLQVLPSEEQKEALYVRLAIYYLERDG
ncbi:S8 family serine peptidase [Pelagicoccus sp. SDUM812005]|uniref:S8 family serine peptidase n=1 Tax=Pelagicoccus sp. SDUM812005 TaxID=3041257 RepID=UPI00280C9081|nr:S8 family serine peptidase [Pelagicoccus sp. SDUM812005]MDQ8183425.1 S8 family serine peptidase [Pelagicoccus sp. SDUM812005]